MKGLAIYSLFPVAFLMLGCLACLIEGGQIAYFWMLALFAPVMVFAILFLCGKK
jgi:hypothetical protein